MAAALVLVAEASPARAQTADDDSLDGTKLTIVKGGGLLVFPVVIDGRQYDFAVDTGASVSIFDRTFRPMLGESVDITRTTTADRVEFHALFRAPAARVAQRPITGLSKVMCLDLSELRELIGIDIYGVLGMDFLREKRVRIDFDRGEAVFLAGIPHGSGTAIPLEFNKARVPAVRLWIVGLGEHQFGIDTGGVCLKAGTIASELFNRSLDVRAAVSLRPGEYWSLSGLSTRRNVRMRSVELNKFRHDGLTFSEGALNSLGVGYLSRFIVTFDFPGKQMHLLPGQHFADPTPRGLSGAGIRFLHGAMTIDLVREGSAAERAGLKVGDVIEQIDSRPGRSFNAFEVGQLLCLPGKYALTVTRGGQRLQLELVLDAADSSEDSEATDVEAKAKDGSAPRSP